MSADSIIESQAGAGSLPATHTDHSFKQSSTDDRANPSSSSASTSLMSIDTSLVPAAPTHWKDALNNPSSLRTTEQLQILRKFCREHQPPLLPTVSDAVLFDLCSFFMIASFRRGQVIYREGERVSFVFFLLAPGNVALTQLDGGLAPGSGRTGNMPLTAPSQFQIPSPTANRSSSKMHKMRSSGGLAGSFGPYSPTNHRSRRDSSRRMSNTNSPYSSTLTAASISNPTTPRSKLLTYVKPGSCFGARFSSSLAEKVPPPLQFDLNTVEDEDSATGEDGDSTERVSRNMFIVASHTAVAKRNVHCMSIPLDIYVRFFPDLVLGGSSNSDVDHPSLPTSPKLNPFTHSPHLKRSNSASNLGMPPSPLLEGLDGTKPSERDVNSGRSLAKSMSEFSLPPPHHRSKTSPHLTFHRHTASTGNLQLEPLAENSSSEEVSAAKPLESLRPAPLQLAIPDLGSSQIIQTTPLLPPELQSSSSQQVNKTPMHADEAARLFAAELSANMSPNSVQRTLASMQKSDSKLAQKGKKMWHVLTDAVGLHTMMKKRRTASMSSTVSTGSNEGAMTSRELWENQLAPLPDNEDIADIEMNEDEELRLKRRMKFFRSVTLGGISRWNHERLLQLISMVEDRRYSGRATIYRQNDPSNYVYFIHTGCIHLSRSLRNGGTHFFDYYSDHIPLDEKSLNKTHAKTAIDVTTGNGALRKVSFETVASHHPNPGQESLKHAIASSIPSSLAQSAYAPHSYTLLREFDFVSSKLGKTSPMQYFALQFQHPGHNLRFSLQANRGAAEIYVCTQNLLPNAQRFSWCGSTHLSARENAFMSSFGSTLQGRGNATTAVEKEEKSALGSVEEDGGSASANAASMNSTVNLSQLSNVKGHSCELVISAHHPLFRLGWFYIGLCVPKGGNNAEFTLRVSALPVEGGGWGNGSSSKAAHSSGLASLGKGGCFGIEGVLNNAARDEEALSLGETLLYAIHKDDFFSLFPPIGTTTNPALTDILAESTQWRLHRAQRHESALRLQKVLNPPPPFSQANPVELSLAHYEKLAARRQLIATAVQRFDDRKAEKAKAKALAATMEALGVETKKPVLAVDAQRLRINHDYKKDEESTSAAGSRIGTAGPDGRSDTFGISSGPGNRIDPLSSKKRPLTAVRKPNVPSQRRTRDGAEATAKKNALADENRMLRDFLVEETRDQRDKNMPSSTHQTLVSAEAFGQHKAHLAHEKAAHGVDPDKHVSLDMAALVRKDVRVIQAEMEQVAREYTLDDIVANRVEIPLPPPERLLSNDQSVLSLALAQAPGFRPVSADPPTKPPPPIRHSETWGITAEVMKAQLQAPFEPSPRLVAGATLEELESKFSRDVPPSNLLALEAGEWQRPRDVHHSPRSNSPTRRVKRAKDEEEKAARSNEGLSTASTTASLSKGNNVKTLRSAVTIYCIDDPSVDALRDFNRSIEATYAREQEFTHAFRAAGKEPSKTREILATKEATKSSHALSMNRCPSKADVSPFALTKQWPLLQSSQSSPLLLMPGTSRPTTRTNRRGGADDVDTNIFDLTSVDTQDDATIPHVAATQPPAEADADNDDQQEAMTNLLDSLAFDVHTASSPSNTKTQQFFVEGDARVPSAEGVRRSSTHVLPQVSMEDGSARSEMETPKSKEPTSRDIVQSAVPVSSSTALVLHQSQPSESDEAAVMNVSSPSSKSLVVSGVELSLLPLEGISAGAIDTGFPTIGTGFVLPPEARTLRSQAFPPEPLTAEQLRALARDMGLHNPSAHPKPLTLARLKREASELALDQYKSQFQSSPLANQSISTAEFRNKGRLMVGFKAKEALIREMEEKLQRQEMEEAMMLEQTDDEYRSDHSRVQSRPFTAMGRMNPNDEEGSEIWDVDEAVDSAMQAPAAHVSNETVAPGSNPSPSKALIRSGSATRLRPLTGGGSSGVVHNPPAHIGFGSAIPHSTQARPVSKPSVPELAANGLNHSQSTGVLDSVGTSQPSSASPSRPRTRSASKHGHPARVAPAFLSTSSLDVPAMQWIRDKMAKQEAEAANQSEEKPPQPQQPKDQQALVRPITAPLAEFSPTAVSSAHIPLLPSHQPKPRQVPKSYFKPPRDLEAEARRESHRRVLGLDKSRSRSRSASRSASRERVKSGNREREAHYIAAAQQAGANGVATTATAGASALAAAEAAQRELHNRRMASARLKRQLAEQAKEKLKAKEAAVAAALEAATQSISDETSAAATPVSTEPTQEEKEASGPLSPSASLLPSFSRASSVVTSPTHARRSSLMGSTGSFAFAEVAGSMMMNKRGSLNLGANGIAASHMRAFSGSWGGNNAPGSSAGSTAPTSPTVSDGSNKDFSQLHSLAENDSSRAVSGRGASSKHSFRDSSDFNQHRTVHFTSPIKRRESTTTTQSPGLPVPKTQTQDVYVRPKMQSFVNAPMMKF